MNNSWAKCGPKLLNAALAMADPTGGLKPVLLVQGRDGSELARAASGCLPWKTRRRRYIEDFGLLCCRRTVCGFCPAPTITFLLSIAAAIRHCSCKTHRRTQGHADACRVEGEFPDDQLPKWAGGCPGSESHEDSNNGRCG